MVVDKSSPSSSGLAKISFDLQTLQTSFMSKLSAESEISQGFVIQYTHWRMSLLSFAGSSFRDLSLNKDRKRGLSIFYMQKQCTDKILRVDTHLNRTLKVKVALLQLNAPMR